MKRIFCIMHKDIIAMKGGKSNTLIIYLFLFSMLGVLSLFLPLIGLAAPCIMGAGFVSMLFQNESIYHSEKLNCVLPISRRELVKSRFILSVSMYFLTCLPFYFIILLSEGIQEKNDINLGMLDIIDKLSANTGGMLTKFESINLLYITALAIGVILLSGSLRSFFTGSSLSSAESIVELSNNRKLWIRLYLFAAAVFVIWGLVISGIIAPNIIIEVFMSLFSRLAGAAGGFMLVAVVMAAALMSVLYRYICTVLEYEEKEL